jgi:PhzF family phenazine biosynthesis protein
MKSFQFKKIDAFTGVHSSGNPAGCVYLDAGEVITEAEMQEIARQLKGFVSEVAFVFPEGNGFYLRYFSSEREVDFCGHATIAALFDLFGNGPLKGQNEVAIRVGKSSLIVKNELAGSGCVFTAAPEAKHLPMKAHIDDITRAIGISSADIDSKYAISIVNSGLNSLLVPLRLASKLTDVLPDLETLAEFCSQNSADIVVLFTDDRIVPGSSYRTRVFAPRFGYLEDPATGSGNAALGSWLLSEGIWKGQEMTIEQGRSYKDPNIIKLRTATVDGKPRVMFGGSATVRIEGRYCLQ